MQHRSQQWPFSSAPRPSARTTTAEAGIEEKEVCGYEKTQKMVAYREEVSILEGGPNGGRRSRLGHSVPHSWSKDNVTVLQPTFWPQR